MLFVSKMIIWFSLISLTACINDKDESSTSVPNQDANNLIAIDSDNDGIENEFDCAPQDSNRWQILRYQFQDQDQDGYVISFAQNQLICTGSQLPLGYLTSAIGKIVGDCDDSSETGMHVFQNVSLFNDNDKDQIGAGIASQYCIGTQIPNGFSVVGTDCNDLDPGSYQELAFTFRDEDQDNHLVALPQSQTICTGMHLPDTYLANAQGKWVGDCDDSSTTGANIYQTVNLFIDKDGDHLGSGNGQQLCIGDSVPAQYSVQSGDCNDEDSSKYQELSFLYRDMDLDNHIIQLPQADKVCTGKDLPSTYLATAVGKWLGDCNDDPITGTEIYRSVGLFADEDGDSYGSGSIQQVCIGATLPTNFSNNADDCDDSLVTGAEIYRFVDLFSDADGDSFGSGSVQNLCIGSALPSDFSNVAGDCNDDDENLFQMLPYNYRDADLDGYLNQSTQVEQVCSGETLSNGYFLTAQDQIVGDCNDNNDQIFQNLPYEYLDLDQDNYVVQLPTRSLVCSGETLPNTHLISAQDKSVGDCDDSVESGREVYRNVALFTDKDGDKYGAGQSHSFCIGDNIPQLYSEDGTDCNDGNSRIYQELNYRYRDRDYDKYLDDSIEPDTICSGASLPGTYFDTTVGRQLGDCDDDPKTGRFLYRTIKLYTSLDGDNYGVGTGQDYCIGTQIPSGLGSFPNDCDDTNSQIYKELSYIYRDEDSDFHLAQAPPNSKICTSNLLPRGYLNNNNSWHPIGDCDDSIETGSQVYRSVELFVDEDGDNVGVGIGATQCIGANIPDKFSNIGSDCNDNDAALYRMRQGYTDKDGDGFGAGESLQLCAGNQLPGGYATNRADCNDENENEWQVKIAKYQDADGDGYLSEMPNSVPMCTGEALPANYSEKKPWRIDCNDDPETGVNVFQRLALFEDLDQDGHGNSEAPLSVQCLGRVIPEKLSVYGGDIDDQNSSAFEYADMAEEELSIILNP